MPRRTVENVIKAFFNGGRDDYFTSNRSLYIDDDHLMSYGAHFTLARRYHVKGHPVYLINSSKSTVTTMGHASKCWQKIHWDKREGDSDRPKVVMANHGWGIDKEGLKWGETKFCTKGKHPNCPKGSHEQAVESFHDNFKVLYRARASYRRQALVGIIGERVKSIRLLEEFFDIEPAKLEIPQKMISRLVKWRLEGETIMGNWKSLMERLNGRGEEQAA